MPASSKKKPHPVAVAFGKALREARNQDGRSQEALALDCDLDRTYIGLLERGVNQPSLGTVFVLADQLSVLAEDLVTATRDTMAAKRTRGSKTTSSRRARALKARTRGRAAKRPKAGRKD